MLFSSRLVRGLERMSVRTDGMSLHTVCVFVIVHVYVRDYSSVDIYMYAYGYVRVHMYEHPYKQGCVSSMHNMFAHRASQLFAQTCMWMYAGKSGAGEAEAQRVNSGEVGAELDLGGDGTSAPASNAAGKAPKDGHPALAIAGKGP